MTATTQGTGCGYLHNAYGPGCPYCMSAMGSAVAQAAAVRAELAAAGLSAAERTAFLLAWDKPPAALTPAETALLDRHYDRAQSLGGAA